jgi:hypothetical protein
MRAGCSKCGVQRQEQGEVVERWTREWRRLRLDVAVGWGGNGVGVLEVLLRGALRESMLFCLEGVISGSCIALSSI